MGQRREPGRIAKLRLSNAEGAKFAMETNDVTREVQHARQLEECLLSLKVCEAFLGQPTVLNIPAEGRELSQRSVLAPCMISRRPTFMTSTICTPESMD